MVSGAMRFEHVVNRHHLRLRFRQYWPESPFLLFADSLHREQIFDVGDSSFQLENLLRHISMTLIHLQYLGWHGKTVLLEYGAVSALYVSVTEYNCDGAHEMDRNRKLGKVSDSVLGKIRTR
jgi:hypothetical protein